MAKTPKKNIHAGHRDRMRESFIKDSEMESFSDFQAVEFFLNCFIPRKDTNVIGHELIEKFGSLYGIATACPSELCQIKGMTVNAASFFPMILPISRRVERSRRERSFQVNTSEDATAAFMPYFIGRNNEILYMMMLDVNDKIIGIECVSKGSGSNVTVDMDAIVVRSSRAQANKILLAHNHPAGNAFPSAEDIRTTSVISNLLLTMGRFVLDHIIFADDEFYSFYDKRHMFDFFKNADKVLNTNYYHEAKMLKSKQHADEAERLQPPEIDNAYGEPLDISGFGVTKVIAPVEVKAKSNKLSDLDISKLGKGGNTGGTPYPKSL